MRHLFAEMGIRPYSVYEATYHENVPAIQCRPLHVFRKHDLGLELCRGEALKGRERLLIFAHSFVSTSGKPTRRRLKTWRFPTELSIAVDGHFEHEGLAAAEESE